MYSILFSGAFGSTTTQSTPITTTSSAVNSSAATTMEQKVIKSEDPSSQDESSQDSVKVKLEPKKEVNKQVRIQNKWAISFCTNLNTLQK